MKRQRWKFVTPHRGKSHRRGGGGTTIWHSGVPNPRGRGARSRFLLSLHSWGSTYSICRHTRQTPPTQGSIAFECGVEETRNQSYLPVWHRRTYINLN